MFIFPGCAREQNRERPTQLRYGFTSEPRTLDPLSPGNTADGRSILFNVFEGLVKPNPDGTFMPAIAESWTIDPAFLIYTFTLREGVRFHDGSIVTAEDVKFSLDTAIANEFIGLNRINEVLIYGENQIKIILNSPDPYFLPFLTVGIIQAGNTNRERVVIGTGPFFIESYTTQRELVLRRFDYYWQRFLDPPREIPSLEKVTIVFFANFEAMMTSLRGGNIDGANLTGAYVAQLNQRDFYAFHNNSSAVQVLALNNARAPFDDVRVRRAISYGIDVQEIINAAFFGSGSHSGSPVIPGLTEYFESNLGYVHNPQRALEYLAQAGFYGGNQISFEIAAPSNYGMHVDTAQVITNQLNRIGIQATIRLVDWSTWLSDIHRDRNYQATVISIDSRVVSARSFLSRYHSENSSNFINFASEDFDRVYASMLTETDSSVRNQLYREAQKIIAGEAASVFIQDIVHYVVLRRGAFGGVLNYPLYVVDFASIYGIGN